MSNNINNNNHNNDNDNNKEEKSNNDDVVVTEEGIVEVVHDPDVDDFKSESGKHSISYNVTKQMAYHPIKIACCVFWIILLIVIVTTVLGVGTISEASEYDWVIASTDESRNLDALDDAKSQVDTVSDVILPRVKILDESFYYVFETTDNMDIYTPANIQQMCIVESTMLETDGWSDVCHLTNGTCTLSDTSISVYFYEFQSAEDWNCTLLNETHVNAKKKPIYDAIATSEGQEEYGTWLSYDAPDLGYSTMCNSFWSFGSPLPGYESDSDRWEDQFKVYQEFTSALDGSVGGVEEKLFDYYDIDDNSDGFFKYYPSPYMSDAVKGSLQVNWFSIFNLQNEFIRLLASDLFFAIFSIFFVVMWMRMHTGSSLTALAGIFMVVMSLPVTVFIYKVIFAIPYYSEIHSLVLFIVLGIGADDIFVLNDSWKLTKDIYHGDITNGKNRETVHRRLLKCYRHTMSTVFNTSFTTSMAFIATGLSPLMPISTFGWFAATCIICNYIFVITLMPPVVVISEMYFENSVIPCQEKKNVKENSAKQTGEENEAQYESVAVSMTKADPSLSTGVELTASTPGNVNGEVVLGASQNGNNLDEVESNLNNVTGVIKSVDSTELSADKPLSFIEKCVNGYISAMEYSIFLFGHEVRIVAIFIMISLIAYGIVGVVYGIQLETPTSQEAWFPDAHMLQKAQFMLSSDFLGSDDAAYASISINLGIAGIDRSDFNEFIPPKNRGHAIFDDNFELANPSCQRAIVRMCDDIPLFECDASACEPTGLIARKDTTSCFMKDFRVWSNETIGVDTYLMNETYFYDMLSTFRYANPIYEEAIGFIDGELKYASVTFTSTMESEEPMKSKIDVQNNVEALLRQIYNYEECDACDCRSIMYTSPYAFVWMRTELGLVRGFYIGMFIAFPVAFGVLLFATGNLFISIYAILSVLFIVFGVLGFVSYALGWDLGTAESIAGIIIIGFSVDYTVHLGHMYTDAEKQLGVTDRKSKFEHAIREIGPTVVGGAITTAGAGSFLFLCQMRFFFKMATLIVSTIVLSYMYSLGFFMSILLVIGPENEDGKVSVLVNWVKEKLNLNDKGVSRVNAEEIEVNKGVENE